MPYMDQCTHALQRLRKRSGDIRINPRLVQLSETHQSNIPHLCPANPSCQTKQLLLHRPPSPGNYYSAFHHRTSYFLVRLDGHHKKRSHDVACVRSQHRFHKYGKLPTYNRTRVESWYKVYVNLVSLWNIAILTANSSKNSYLINTLTCIGSTMQWPELTPTRNKNIFRRREVIQHIVTL